MKRIERASELIGRPVITLDGGICLGEVKDVLIDPHDSQLVGFTIRGQGLFSTANKGVLAAESISSIGRDALMIPSSAALSDQRDEVSRLMAEHKEVIGKEAVSADGQSLGAVADVIIEIDGPAATVVGYELAGSNGIQVIVPVPQSVAMSGDALVVPDYSESRAASGLASFRDVLERTRG